MVKTRRAAYPAAVPASVSAATNAARSTRFLIVFSLLSNRPRTVAANPPTTVSSAVGFAPDEQLLQRPEERGY
jgi:hypothetical protein